MSIEITNIVEIIIALLGALITAFLIPWLRSKISATKREQIAETVRVLVKSAEQLFGAGKGEEKLQYVVMALKQAGYAVNIEDVSDKLRAMIEAAVLELGK